MEESIKERAGCVGMQSMAHSSRPISPAATSGSTSRLATSRACVTSWPPCWSSWMMVSVSSLTCRRGRVSLTLCHHGLGQDRGIADPPGGYIPTPAVPRLTWLSHCLTGNENKVKLVQTVSQDEVYQTDINPSQALS